MYFTGRISNAQNNFPDNEICGFAYTDSEMIYIKGEANVKKKALRPERPESPQKFRRQAVSPHAQEGRWQPLLQWLMRGTMYRVMMAFLS